ncbi:MAG: 7-carboxy-7-deazaguanine synthase QueE, partial [Nitrospirae bacterium]|nr:7-carboxy-7-deazaguanine synthase QueE [Nitrospirota bacterium]
MTGGYLSEIYSAIQGEGIFVGERELFVRFLHCDLHCAYCDTENEPRNPDTCLVEQTPGKRDFEPLPNPIEPEAVWQAVRRLDTPRGLHRRVSVTGGEPLLQEEFLKAWLVENPGYPILLETSGIHVRALEQVIHHLDGISMDIKLPSAGGEGPFWEAHVAFLQEAVSRRGKPVYVKVVVAGRTTDAEVMHAAALLRERPARGRRLQR